MWVADMDFASPPEVVRALHERVDHGIFGYGFVRDASVDAFRDWYERRHGYRPGENVVFLPGVMAGVRAAIEAFTDLGEGVVVQTPVYAPLMNAVQEKGRALIVNELVLEGHRYRMDYDDLASVFAGGARMLLLCSPHNPVGRVWSAEELAQCLKIAGEYGALVVSDEIHGDLVFEPGRFVAARQVSTRHSASSMAEVLTLAAPSKTFNIPGLPGAFAELPTGEHAARFRAVIKRDGLDIANVLSVAAAEAAYRSGDDWLNEVLTYIGETEREVRERLSGSSIGMVPVPLEGTYLLWLDCRSISMDDRRLRSYLERESKVRLIAGSWFGRAGGGFLRMNIAAPRHRVLSAVDRMLRGLEGGRPSE